ncbi:MAG: DUF3048 domain-containing protein [Actinomycetota bacterium]|nr:DUF3048 domain-containing protein [Actinomycetota bacterium]
MHPKAKFVAASVSAAALLAACGSSPAASTTTSTRASTTTTAPPPTYALTGLPQVPGGPNPNRPPLMVKIDNAPQAWPQSGIDHTDIVYEEQVEGGLTRYMVVFQSQNAAKVGPIRSVRATDAALAAQTGGLLAYSGGIPTFVADVRATGVVDVGANLAGSAYYRDYSRPEPHNLYSSTAALYKAAGGRGSTPHALFSYVRPGTSEPAALSKPASAFSIAISGAVTDTWTYNSANSDWTKSINGTQVTTTSGSPITATNVIIEYVNYVNTGFVDPAGNPVPEAQLVGSGTGEVAFGGRIATAKWAKPSEAAVPTYTYSNGQPVKVLPGRTWVIFAPIGATLSVQG